MKKAAPLSILFAVILFAVAVIAEAQQPKKMPLIGYLSVYDPITEASRSDAIRVGLRELGYIEGQNIATEYRYAEGKRDRYPELAAELVRLKVDLIVIAGGFIPIQIVMNATKTVRDGGELPRKSSGVLAEKLAEFHSLRFDLEKRIDVSTLRRGRCNHQSQNKRVLQSVCNAQDLETTPEGSQSRLSVSTFRLSIKLTKVHFNSLLELPFVGRSAYHSE